MELVKLFYSEIEKATDEQKTELIKALISWIGQESVGIMPFSEASKKGIIKEANDVVFSKYGLSLYWIDPWDISTGLYFEKPKDFVGGM